MAAIDPRLCETTSCPTNIACIKYWGKADRKFNTPINSSVSVTLNQDDLRAITTVVASKDFSSDRLWLNGEELDINDVSKNSHAKRFQTCLLEMRKLAEDRIDPNTGDVLVRKEDWSQYRIHVVSRNTFPTAAGLASSAAGYACLVFALSKLFQVKASLSDISVIARQGSGSACRSLFGGFVKWEQGTAAANWQDSRAVPVASKEDWEDMATVILVANDKKKDTSSTSGMNTSVETSPLLAFRAREVVDGRLAAIEKAYRARNFSEFGQLTMADSNQFHATCLDTYPPIFYLNDVSRQIIRLVHAFNDYYGEIRAAYTFDAGPNAVIFVLKKHQSALLSYMLHYFPPPSMDATPSRFQSFSNRPGEVAVALDTAVDPGLIAAGDATGRTPVPGDVKMVYLTGVGDGPRVLTGDSSEWLVDPGTGLPKDNMISSGAEVEQDDKTDGDGHMGVAGQVKNLSQRIACLERSLTHQFSKLERLLGPATVPSAQTVMANLLRFSTLYLAFYGGLAVASSFAKGASWKWRK
uniref:Diphosphomevalonate decarboxylase n=1 Tax=Rhizochromulina marina TaxID=1034831 RepID=A0A7S2RMS8_9STRA